MGRMGRMGWRGEARVILPRVWFWWRLIGLRDSVGIGMCGTVRLDRTERSGRMRDQGGLHHPRPRLGRDCSSPASGDS
jgi:hypothetical protein